MFYVMGAKRAGDFPALDGPFGDFEEASNHSSGWLRPIVIHWSRVYGWLQVWAHDHEAPVPLMESTIGDVLRSRVHHAERRRSPSDRGRTERGSAPGLPGRAAEEAPAADRDAEDSPASWEALARSLEGRYDADEPDDGPD